MTVPVQQKVKRSVYTALVKLTAVLLRRVNSREAFQYWETQGLHVTPVHYYSPIPNTGELAADYPRSSQLIGLDLNEPRQQEYLTSVFPRYAGECRHFQDDTRESGKFSANNAFFYGIDPYVYYCMIRHHRPERVIEVGAGFSTTVALEAAEKNGAVKITAVEPYPSRMLRANADRMTLLEQKVERLDFRIFEALTENDILFIDSSHVARTGSDVTYLFSEVLPRLKPGVLVHVHDIFLPDPYPQHLVTQKHQFWNEQFILQAYLTGHTTARIIFANHYMVTRYPDAVQAAFPGNSDWRGLSLWMQI